MWTLNAIKRLYISITLDFFFFFFLKMILRDFFIIIINYLVYVMSVKIYCWKTNSKDSSLYETECNY
jgi:hypothetical protein